MFGISLLELVIIIILLIIFIKPEEYIKIYQFLMTIILKFKFFYKTSLDEIKELKDQSGLSDIDKKLQEDIEGLDSEIKKIVGDDGQLYDSYDVSTLLSEDKDKN
jgi:Sec-independent protein translocase protein TatA